MERKIIRYKFSRLFPQYLKPSFLMALLKAIEMWEKSGNVSFILSQDKPDFIIGYEVIGKEYGDISKRLYSPDISYRNSNIQDTTESAIIVNCNTKWRTKWYQLFHKEFDPIILAHNLGHIMGLCNKKHVSNLHSVMFENPIMPPGESDFHIMRIALSKLK